MSPRHTRTVAWSVASKEGTTWTPWQNPCKHTWKNSWQQSRNAGLSFPLCRPSRWRYICNMTRSETFILIPGRTSRQGTSLNEGKFSAAYLEETSTLLMSPEDMKRLALTNGDRVRLRTE